MNPNLNNSPSNYATKYYNGKKRREGIKKLNLTCFGTWRPQKDNRNNQQTYPNTHTHTYIQFTQHQTTILICICVCVCQLQEPQSKQFFKLKQQKIFIGFVLFFIILFCSVLSLFCFCIQLWLRAVLRWLSWFVLLPLCSLLLLTHFVCMLLFGFC